MQQSRVTQVSTNGQFEQKWECIQETTSGSSCFPADSLVSLSNGELIKMNELQLFDKVMTIDEKENAIEDTVIGFLHQNSSKSIDYINLAYGEQDIIKISPYHVIFIQRNNEESPILAKNVIVGDLIYSLSENSWKSVNSITVTHELGFYSPLTLSGKLIVDNALVSCYANFPKQETAHLAFLPYRLLYYSLPESIFGSEYLQAKNEETLHWYANALMELSKKMGSELNYIEQSNQ